MLKKSIDNKQYGKGVCTSDDVKPVENIANGSELVEIDTGKRCVFDEGQSIWIEYGTGEDRSGSGTSNPNTVTIITGTLADPWGDLGFETIRQGLLSHNMSALITASLGGTIMYAPLEAYEQTIYMGQAGTMDDGYVASSILWANLGAQVTKTLYLLNSNGGYQDLSSALSDDLETTLTVISHPLPESEAGKL